MQAPNISPDDLIDVMEMTHKLEEYIYIILKDNNLDLAISALMSASINCTLAQCKSLDEVKFYRNLFVQLLDGAIKTIRVQNPEKH